MYPKKNDTRSSTDDSSCSTSGLSDSSFEQKNVTRRRKGGVKRDEKSSSSSPLNQKSRFHTQNKSMKSGGLPSKSSPHNTKNIGKPASSKVHDRPMEKRDLYFALDCEMVGVGPDGMESALARVSIVNWENVVVLDTYVRVDQPVTDFRTFVSGVTKENIQSKYAMPIESVRSIVANILRGKILIGHALENDLKVMGLSHPQTDVRDTAKYEPFMKSIESKSPLQGEECQTLLRPRKLRDLVWEKLGKEIQVIGKAHSPIEDAIAAMDLYKSVRPEWENAMAKDLHRRLEQVNVARIESPRGAHLNYLSSVHFASPRNISYPSHVVAPIDDKLGCYDIYAQGQYFCPNYAIQHRNMSQLMDIHSDGTRQSYLSPFHSYQSQQKTLYI